jgi:hypothetical protein
MFDFAQAIWLIVVGIQARATIHAPDPMLSPEGTLTLPGVGKDLVQDR